MRERKKDRKRERERESKRDDATKDKNKFNGKLRSRPIHTEKKTPTTFLHFFVVFRTRRRRARYGPPRNRSTPSNPQTPNPARHAAYHLRPYAKELGAFFHIVMCACILGGEKKRITRENERVRE